MKIEPMSATEVIMREEDKKRKEYIDKLFEGSIIKQCMLLTIRQRIWGAWQVLSGKAGIILIKIKYSDFYNKE